MNKITLCACVALALSSCRASRPTAPHPPVMLNNADSVRTESVITTVYLPTPVALDIPAQSHTVLTTADSSHVETDMAESDAWINADGTLGHSIRNKPGTLEGEVYVPHTAEHDSREAVRVREVPVPQPYPVEVERSLSLMERVKLAAFWYLAAVALLALALLLRRPLWRALRKILPR